MSEVHAFGGGWLLFAFERGWVVARFAADERGRLNPVALHVDLGRPIASNTLRSLSLARMEAVANRPDVREQLAARWEQPAPDLRQAPMRLPPPNVAGRRPAVRLKAPAGRKPDDFYAKVAEVYQRLAAEGNRPAIELAEANGVPVTTAHRWIREARRRGHLPPGQKGRRG